MGFNSPVPVRLPEECSKARKIFNSFLDGSNNGLDQVIPRSVLQQAKGFAIFTVAKAGFVVSARAGSGIVIARLPNGEWSAPTAIGTAGLGFGGQAGAEVTDFLIVLNSRSAVASFMAAGSLNLGGNMSLAVGPLGRNAEGMGALNTKGKVAAMYSYSKTKGLFGGVSVEGSVIVERQDANRQAYGSNVTAKQLLSGVIDIPPFAESLVAAIIASTNLPGGRTWIEDSPATSQGTGWEPEPIPSLGSPSLGSPTTERGSYAFAGLGSSSGVVNGGGGGAGGKESKSANRSRSGSLLSSVVGRDRSGSLQSTKSGRDRGGSVGSATGSASGRPESPSSRPGLFSSVSFGRKRGNSRGLADAPGAIPGHDDNFHSSESYTSAAPPSGLKGTQRSTPTIHSPLKPTSHFATQFNSNFSQDSLQEPISRAARSDDLLSLEENFGRTMIRQSSDDSRLSAQRYSIDDPSFQGASSSSPFDDYNAANASVTALQSTSKPKKSRPFSTMVRSSSSKATNDFHTQSNRYYEDDVFSDPDPVIGDVSSSRGKQDGSVRAEEDWAALGSRARAGLARTQSGNVLSAAAVGSGAASPRVGSTANDASDMDTETLRTNGFVGRGVAVYDFVGVESGDLSFSRGDVILLTQKTTEANDWWTGTIGLSGAPGNFPGTYIQLVD